jgi:collagenase-like PrtC family protease
MFGPPVAVPCALCKIEANALFYAGTGNWGVRQAQAEFEKPSLRNAAAVAHDEGVRFRGRVQKHAHTTYQRATN